MTTSSFTFTPDAFGPHLRFENGTLYILTGRPQTPMPGSIPWPTSLPVLTEFEARQKWREWGLYPTKAAQYDSPNWPWAVEIGEERTHQVIDALVSWLSQKRLARRARTVDPLDPSTRAPDAVLTDWNTYQEVEVLSPDAWALLEDTIIQKILYDPIELRTDLTFDPWRWPGKDPHDLRLIHDDLAAFAPAREHMLRNFGDTTLYPFPLAIKRARVDTLKSHGAKMKSLDPTLRSMSTALAKLCMVLRIHSYYRKWHSTLGEVATMLHTPGLPALPSTPDALSPTATVDDLIHHFRAYARDHHIHTNKVPNGRVAILSCPYCGERFAVSVAYRHKPLPIHLCVTPETLDNRMAGGHDLPPPRFYLDENHEGVGGTAWITRERKDEEMAPRGPTSTASEVARLTTPQEAGGVKQETAEERGKRSETSAARTAEERGGRSDEVDERSVTDARWTPEVAAGLLTRALAALTPEIRAKYETLEGRARELTEEGFIGRQEARESTDPETRKWGYSGLWLNDEEMVEEGKRLVSQEKKKLMNNPATKDHVAYEASEATTSASEAAAQGGKRSGEATKSTSEARRKQEEAEEVDPPFNLEERRSWYSDEDKEFFARYPEHEPTSPSHPLYVLPSARMHNPSLHGFADPQAAWAVIRGLEPDVIELFPRFMLDSMHILERECRYKEEGIRLTRYEERLRALEEAEKAQWEQADRERRERWEREAREDAERREREAREAHRTEEVEEEEVDEAPMARRTPSFSWKKG